MERGKHKLEVVSSIGEVKENGRVYRIVEEKVIDTGQLYTAVKLYNKDGKFIKRFMMEPQVAAAVAGLILKPPNIKLLMAEEAARAWKSLAGYKFYMFGYHASSWVKLNKMLEKPLPNPFRGVVNIAKEIIKGGV